MKRNLMVEITCARRGWKKRAGVGQAGVGQPMFGEAKAIAVWWFAEKWKLNLASVPLWDSVHDQWMLRVWKTRRSESGFRLRMTARRRAGKLSMANKIFGENEDRKMVPESAR